MTNNNYFPNPYQQFIYKSRYSRYLEDEKRREDWHETVARYFDFFEEHLAEQHSYRLSPELRRELEEAVLNQEVMPSMRGLMTAGEALRRDQGAIYNCAYFPVDSKRSFDEELYTLMLGTGTGFTVEQFDVSQLPNIHEEFHNTSTKIVVEDSKIGWAKAFRELISLLTVGQIPEIDYSKIRPKGARLKTFGGRASGPEPLKDLFDFTTATFRKAAGRRLTTLEAHDLACKIADIVVVGGVRRSALISLSDLGDDRMRTAKSGAWWELAGHRRLANNSAVYKERPEIGLFMKEWISLYESKSGERGIFSRTAAVNVIENSNKFREEHFGGRARQRDTNHRFGCNPCCVSGDTPILTARGYFPIESLVGYEVRVWNGSSFEWVNPYHAGNAPLYRVTLSDGTFLDCTSNHKWVDKKGVKLLTEELEPGTGIGKFSMPVVDGDDTPDIDAYSQGFYGADGNSGYNFSFVYEPKYPVCSRLIGTFNAPSDKYKRRVWKHGPLLDKTFVPVNASVSYKINWLAGLLDGDGTKVFSDKTKTSYSLQIASVDMGFLQRVRLMLTSVGVQAKIGLMHEDGRKFDGYDCQACYRICINTTDVLILKELGLKTERIELTDFMVNRDARRFVTVVSVERLTEEAVDVFCFTEPKTSLGTFNGIVTGNSEIILRPYQFCNLSEIVVRPTDNLESLKRKARIATILGTFQATLTKFRYLSKKWQKNCEDERLLGVSMTGIYDNTLLNGKEGLDELKAALQAIKLTTIETNIEFAEDIGINSSVAITAVKPSGTVSALNGTASGIHPRHSPYYIRYVRNDIKDPVTPFLIAQGVAWEKDAYDPNNMVAFKFPFKSPEGAVFRSDLGAIEHLELWKVYQQYYCEHKPSVTITVKENEWLDVGAWVYKNMDWMSGVSFLPHSDHVYKQAPFTDCTKTEYEALLAVTPKTIDWSKLSEYEKTDTTTGTQELACSGAIGCEV
jgi:ribonucleotide reductase class II